MGWLANIDVMACALSFAQRFPMSSESFAVSRTLPVIHEIKGNMESVRPVFISVPLSLCRFLWIRLTRKLTLAKVQRGLLQEDYRNADRPVLMDGPSQIGWSESQGVQKEDV